MASKKPRKLVSAMRRILFFVSCLVTFEESRIDASPFNCEHILPELKRGLEQESGAMWESRLLSSSPLSSLSLSSATARIDWILSQLMDPNSALSKEVGSFYGYSAATFYHAYDAFAFSQSYRELVARLSRHIPTDG